MPNGAKEKNKHKLLLSISYQNPAWWSSKTRHLHSHDFCEVMFVKKGDGSVKFDDSVQHFHTGDIVIYNPGTTHCEFVDDGSDSTLIFIGISNLSIDCLEPGCLCRGRYSVVPTDSHYDAIFFYLDQLLAEQDQLNIQGVAISKELLNIIIANILRLSEDASRAIENRKTYTEVKLFLDANYTTIDTIDELCHNLYINKFYLTHLFSQRYGISPLQYIIKKRVALAKHLLVNTDLKVDGVANACGYDDVAYFCRIFKKQENITPLQFRKKHRIES